MTRETAPENTIALLATGDEITNGDILNSNAQEIASRLFHQGMHVGMHLTAADNLSIIETAILFLLQKHRALIITGGLGPTSDDITRHALANALNSELLFDEKVWDAIVERLNRFGYHTPPQTNRQQALFPKGAAIIANPNGTAAGCMLQQEDKFIFMLPGPPIECLPMIDNVVLPTLKEHNFQEILFHKKWLVFGVSEGQIAEELDALAKPYACTTGYRLCYPYIEFKLYSNHEQDFKTLLPLVENVIQPYLIDDGQKTASEKLKEKLLSLSFTLGIVDSATGGLLESLIKTPETYSHIHFFTDIKKSADELEIQIHGLEEYWQEEYNHENTTLNIDFNHLHLPTKLTYKIPFRGKRVKQYAVEFICLRIYEFVKKYE